MQLIENFLNLMIAKRDDDGATAVEYGLMVALIAVAIIAMVSALGGKLGAPVHRDRRRDLSTAVEGAGVRGRRPLHHSHQSRGTPHERLAP